MSLCWIDTHRKKSTSEARWGSLQHSGRSWPFGKIQGKRLLKRQSPPRSIDLALFRRSDSREQLRSRALRVTDIRPNIAKVTYNPRRCKETTTSFQNPCRSSQFLLRESQVHSNQVHGRPPTSNCRAASNIQAGLDHLKGCLANRVSTTSQGHPATCGAREGRGQLLDCE